MTAKFVSPSSGCDQPTLDTHYQMHSHWHPVAAFTIYPPTVWPRDSEQLCYNKKNKVCQVSGFKISEGAFCRECYCGSKNKFRRSVLLENLLLWHKQSMSNKLWVSRQDCGPSCFYQMRANVPGACFQHHKASFRYTGKLVDNVCAPSVSQFIGHSTSYQKHVWCGPLLKQYPLNDLQEATSPHLPGPLACCYVPITVPPHTEGVGNATYQQRDQKQKPLCSPHLCWNQTEWPLINHFY